MPLALMIVLALSNQSGELIDQPGRYGEIGEVARKVSKGYSDAQTEKMTWVDFDKLIFSNKQMIGQTGHYRVDGIMCQRVAFTCFSKELKDDFFVITRRGREFALKAQWEALSDFFEVLEINFKFRLDQPSSDDIRALVVHIKKNAVPEAERRQANDERTYELFENITAYSTLAVHNGGVPKEQLPLIFEAWNTILDIHSDSNLTSINLGRFFSSCAMFATAQLNENLARKAVVATLRRPLTDENIFHAAAMAATISVAMPSMSRSLIRDLDIRVPRLAEKEQADATAYVTVAKAMLKIQDGEKGDAVRLLEGYQASSLFQKADEKVAATFNLIASILKRGAIPPVQLGAMRGTALLELTRAFGVNDYPLAIEKADGLLAELSQDDPFYSTALDLKVEAHRLQGTPAKDLLKDARRCRDLYLAQWSNRFEPSTPTGIFQELQANPLNRLGTLIAEAGETSEGLATIEAGRGWSALAAIVRSPSKVDVARTLSKMPDLQSALKSTSGQEVALSFVVHPDRKPCVFVLSKGKLIKVDLNLPEGQIAKKITAWRKTLETPNNANRATEEQLSQEIYATLLGPVEKVANIKTATRIRIVADGVLNAVPFGALSPKKGERLIDRGRHIVMSPTLRTLPASPTKSKGEIGFVIPDLGTKAQNVDAMTLSPLTELRGATTKLSKSIKSPVLAGTLDAAKVEATLAKWRVANFVTHGILTPGRDLENYLMLGWEKGTPKRLSVRQIAQMNLNLDQACIWACDSATGQAQGGDGNLSLSWAFLAAGCRQTLATKWKVEQTATTNLITYYYEGMTAFKQEPEEAFFQAVRSVKATPAKSHPYYWAPFEYTSSL